MIDDALIDRLCAIAGAIMEDQSAGAILTDVADRDTRIARIRIAGTDCVALADAAEVLVRRMR